MGRILYITKNFKINTFNIINKKLGKLKPTNCQKWGIVTIIIEEFTNTNLTSVPSIYDGRALNSTFISALNQLKTQLGT